MTRPENALAAKLSRSKVSATDLEKRFAEAEAQVAVVAAGFAEWVAQDLAVAQAEVDKLEKGDGDQQSVRTIFRIVHDIKGQGGTFGYNLATTIAAPLCDFIRSATQLPTAAQLGVIKGHLMALDVVIRKNIKGDGDDMLQGLVEKLAIATSRIPPLS
jgi:chemotaxis protein histidine kinase CheA